MRARALAFLPLAGRRGRWPRLLRRDTAHPLVLLFTMTDRRRVWGFSASSVVRMCSGPARPSWPRGRGARGGVVERRERRLIFPG